MFKYIAKRLLVAIPTFSGITAPVCLASTVAPESPLEMLMTDLMATKEGMGALKTQTGLDNPAIIQYFQWFGAMLQGNSGILYRSSLPALGQILEKLGPTLIFILLSTALSILVIAPLDIMSAYKPYSAWDYASSEFASVGASIPALFTGLVMTYPFEVKLRILPMGGMYDVGVHTVGSAVNHLTLPCLVLTTFNMDSILRQIRGNMVEVFSEDYIRTARAKGFVEPRVVIVHGFRNALIPVVTVLSTMVPFMLGGAVVAGQVFSWPGLGSLMVQSINVRDCPMIVGITVVVAAVVLMDNVLMDIAYSLFDPKIRESR